MTSRPVHRTEANRTPGELKALPYYRWYVDGHRASRKVQALSYVAEGLLRSLLDECWKKGGVPDDLEKLADICRCPVSVMAEHWPSVKRCLATAPGLDGMFLLSPRLEKERTKEDGKRAKARLAGQMGGLSKSQRGKQMLANASDCQRTPDSRVENREVGGAEADAQGDATRLSAGATTCQSCGGRRGIHAPECVLAGSSANA